MNIELLYPYIQKYTWGDTQWLQHLLGCADEKSGEPWAELWLGTHPKGMTHMSQGGRITATLAEYIQNRPTDVLGPLSVEPFDEGLPFLFKILAVGTPLSIQCHPTKVQAREGFDREELAGIPLSAANRNYRDKNHKPEIICAVTSFTALCGFRKIGEITALFTRYLPEVYSLLFGNFFENENLSEEAAYRYLLQSILQLEGSERAACMQLIRNSLASLKDDSQEIALLRKFTEIHPEDPSVLAPLYLQIINLEPGEALYQPAGELHAYISGIGIELMANSDNVLRGGLTEKYVDVQELLHVVKFRYSAKKKTLPFGELSGLYAYHTPAQDFDLHRIETGTYSAGKNKYVKIMIQLSGKTEFVYTNPDSHQEKSFLLSEGKACIIPAAVRDYTMRTIGTVFCAGIPDEGELI
ncbi:MAG: mannose-6-phosphate isomerase, class I [Spirochaetales bacterium]|jgi:mannose-6-phosphate isomerase|nr:mannose-6-phosphate isomerase, class I [Spirochaetales bacterium]